jgi:hypothetical protein
MQQQAILNASTRVGIAWAEAMDRRELLKGIVAAPFGAALAGCTARTTSSRTRSAAHESIAAARTLVTASLTSSNIVTLSDSVSGATKKDSVLRVLCVGEHA